MKCKRIIFMGTPAFAVPSLNALIEAGCEILTVVTQPDKPRGRGMSISRSPVKEAALKAGLRVIEPASVKDPAVIEELRRIGPDLIVVVAYGKILPQALLDIPPMGCVNVHSSLLPRHRGASPICHAILNGDKITGVSTMLMDKGVDTGGVLLEEKVEIGEEETAGELTERLSPIGAALLIKTLKLMSEGNITPRAQDEAGVSYAAPFNKEDGAIDWNDGSSDVANKVRAMNPWPGAFTRWKDKILKVHRGRIVAGGAAGENETGAVIDAKEGRIIVQCGVGAYEILILQPENKRQMASADFLKGYRLLKGDRFA